MGRAAKGKQKAAPNSGSSASSAGTKKKDERRPKAAAPAFGDALERELAAVGLRVQRITADGNCMFRAAADQMHGDEDRHAALRQRACDLMEARREEFEPFVEDDESFDAYLKRMRKDGVWGGHLELFALSHVANANIFVYQEGQPRWTVKTTADGAPSLHLSYHGQEHYNSVRLVDDYGRGPPQPIRLGEGGATAADHARERATWTAADEARVAANTGCDSPALIQRALRDACGDVDAAVEAVIEIMAGGASGGSGGGGGGNGGDGDSGPVDEGGSGCIGTAQGEQESGAQAEQGQASTGQEGEATAIAAPAPPAAPPAAAAAANTDVADEPAGANDAADRGAGSSDSGAVESQLAAAAKPKAKAKSRGVAVGGAASSVAIGGGNKKPSRSKSCPCGSGRKFKSCCGVAAAAAERRQRALQEAASARTEGGLPAVLATLQI